MYTNVVLNKEEYDSLLATAQLTNEEIEKKAEELWQEKGSYGLDVTLRFDKEKGGIGSDYQDTFVFNPYSYVKDWTDNDKSCFPLTNEEKKKFNKFICNMLKKFMKKEWGEQIDDINYIQKQISDYKKERKLYQAITYTGWTVAILTVIAILL
jgi:hypothetical protein